MSLIQDNNELASICNKIKEQKLIAIDTEFIRNQTYYPKLCLLQIFDGINICAIDPLQNLDLKPIFEILRNKNIVKVFHSGKQDIEILNNLMGEVPKNIADTQIIADMCGVGDMISYQTLVKEMVGKRIDKTLRHSDWSKRPLSEKKINYALDDVRYLLEVYEVLINKPIYLERQEWVYEEYQRLLDSIISNVDIYKIAHKVKISNFGNKRLLNKIIEWREKKAQELNIPRNFVLDDSLIINICDNKTHDFTDFYLLDEIFQQELMSIINYENTHDFKDSNYKNILDKKISPEQIDLLELFKMFLKFKARCLNISPRLIATNNDLEKYILKTDSSKIIKGWRYQVFGKYLVDIQSGKINLSYQNGKVIFE